MTEAKAFEPAEVCAIVRTSDSEPLRVHRADGELIARVLAGIWERPGCDLRFAHGDCLPGGIWAITKTISSDRISHQRGLYMEMSANGPQECGDEIAGAIATAQSVG
jgi:hypothetical protein